jgi:serine/threonine protein kinase
MGANVDVYLLGCILSKMLTKSEPFPGKNDSDIFQQKKLKSINVKSSFSQPISKFTMRIIEGCLQYNKDNRFSMAELCNF